MTALTAVIVTCDIVCESDFFTDTDDSGFSYFNYIKKYFSKISKRNIFQKNKWTIQLSNYE